MRVLGRMGLGRMGVGSNGMGSVRWAQMMRVYFPERNMRRCRVYIQQDDMGDGLFYGRAGELQSKLSIFAVYMRVMDPTRFYPMPGRIVRTRIKGSNPVYQGWQRKYSAQTSLSRILTK